MNPGNFFAELKRRNVYRVAVAYAVVAWAFIQAASILFPTFEAPAWVMKGFVVIIAAGFVVALFLAWAFEMTPEGMKRTENVGPKEGTSQWSGRKFVVPLVVVAMAAAALFAYQWFRPKPAIDPPGIPSKSIAVLPFENLSDDKANAYFVTGIQDEIITKLAQLGQLKVISRTSAAKYKSRPDNLRAVANELGVATILEGSVQKSGDEVRINVQLIDAQTDQPLWAQSYTRTLKNIFEVEAEVAGKVAEALQLKLAPDQLKRLSTVATTNPRAHELYLRARTAGTHSDEASALHQIALLREVLAEDPRYSAAWAELVNAYFALADAYRPPLELLPAMQQAALKAIETDDNAAAGHASLGAIAMWYARDFPLAKRELERAVALEPNSSEAHLWYGWYLARVERDFAAARAQIALARTLDPKSTWPLWRESSVALAHGDYEGAMRLAEQLIQTEPDFFYDVDPIGRVYVAMGRWQDALRRYESLPPSILPAPNFEMAVCYAHLGDTARAREILARLEKRSRERYVDKSHLAAIYAALGEKDNAFAALEQAAQERSARVSAPRFHYWLAPLFDDPRFTAFEYKIAHSAIVPSPEPTSR